jgi:hypothetical protein
MSNGTLQIQNELAGPLSLDIRLDKYGQKVIRTKLAGKGQTGDSVDVGDVATLDDLNANPEFQALYSAGSISTAVATGTSVVPGSDMSTAVPNAEGLGGAEWLAVQSAPADGTDHNIVASMPWPALVLDSQFMLATPEGGVDTWTLYDAAAAGGNTLSQAFDANAVAGRQRDDGTGGAAAGTPPALAKGDPIYVNKSAGTTSVGTIMILLQRIS